MTPLYCWIDHTGRYDGNSGVQRVVRSLAHGLVAINETPVLVSWLPELLALERAPAPHLETLGRFGGPFVEQAMATGPLHLQTLDRGCLAGAWLIVPEVTHASSDGAADLTADVIAYAHAHAMRVAFVFYDLIPLLLPGYEDIAAGHERYVAQLACADLILPISRYAAATLERRFSQVLCLPLAERPQIIALPLAESAAGSGGRPELDSVAAGGPIEIVCLGTLEPRKNQITLLHAFNALCAARLDLDMRLTVVGHTHPQVAAEISALAAENPRVRLASYLTDAQVDDLYRRCRFAVFPSVEEGYGLPIVEALWRGRPVICADFGSMAELAEGGGCLTVDTRSAVALERALERLADDDALVSRLTSAAVHRTFRGWDDYARNLLAALRDAVPLRELFMDPAPSGARRLERLSAATEALGVRLTSLAAAKAAPGALTSDPDGCWAVVSILDAHAQAVERLQRLGLRVCVLAEAGELDAAAWLGACAADLIAVATPAQAEALVRLYRRRRERLVNLDRQIVVVDDGVDDPAWAHMLIDRMAQTQRPPERVKRSLAAAQRSRPPDRPLLSVCITTYNRAGWLRHSLARLLELAASYPDEIEVVVCDNASSDETPAVVAALHATHPSLCAHRNPANVGMLGNLGATALHARGEYVWLLGDDDILVPGVVEDVLTGIIDHPNIETIYINYGYTGLEDPGELIDVDSILHAASEIADGGQTRYVPALREVALLNENLFTAIYACVFRRDHALRAYTQDTSGPPFSSLATCIPTSSYVLRHLLDRPAWWIGPPGVVVNLNVSWKAYLRLWHLERMPELYALAERRKLWSTELETFRFNHARGAAELVRDVFFDIKTDVRPFFALDRLLQNTLHLPGFRSDVLADLLAVYDEADAGGRLLPTHATPAHIRAMFGDRLNLPEPAA